VRTTPIDSSLTSCLWKLLPIETPSGVKPFLEAG
jgi:hypothetical protein